MSVVRADSLVVHDLAAVQQVDALRAIHSVSVPLGGTRRWWLKCLYWVMDVMTINAAAIYNQMRSARTPSPGTTPLPKLSRRDFIVHMLHGLEEEREHRPCSTQGETPAPSAHLPGLKTTRGSCWVCSRAGKDRRTKNGCHHPNCPPNLRLCHPQMSWNKTKCFEVYHKAPQLYRRKRRRRSTLVSPEARPTSRHRLSQSLSK